MCTESERGSNSEEVALDTAVLHLNALRAARSFFTQEDGVWLSKASK